MAAETHTIKVGQVYESCDPRDALAAGVSGADLPRIRIVDYTPGMNRADVVDATTGQRPRSILVSSLHASGITSQGLPRRTGYRLVQDVA
jgi:hypothetical protein